MSRFTIATLASSDFDSAANWNKLSLVNSTYAWTVSASGTNEYYVRLSGGTDPSLSEPPNVYEGGAAMTAGTVGALAVGEWDYADNDTLGYSTIYVRLSASATAVDPDDNPSDYVTYGKLPVANDDLGFLFSGTMSGSDQSSIEYDDIEVYSTCTGAAGTQDDYLKLDQGTANSVVFAGTGAWYLDMGTSGSASVRVDQTKAGVQGSSGFYFKNDTNAITSFYANAGSTRLVDANITTLVVSPGATVIIDSASTIPTIINNGGSVVDYGCTNTTYKQTAGTTVREGSDDFALSMYGGVFYWDGTGTCTATTYNGTLDAERDAQTKTLALTYNGGTVLKGSNTSIGTPTVNAPAKISPASQ